MTLRLFCALPIPQFVQAELSQTTRDLKAVLPQASISWVKPSNVHLTLSFLGEVEENRVAQLALQLRAACEPVNSFELRCQQLGCFPNANRPRVIWAGAHSPANELAQLQSRVAKACAPFAEREEKGHFKAHITLGRVRALSNPQREELTAALERAREFSFGEWPAKNIELISSDLSGGAPRYTTLHHFALSEPPV